MIIDDLYKENKIVKMGKRRFPVNVKTEDINDDGEFYMNCIDLLKKGTMNYVVYGHLQLNSNFDEEHKSDYRKIYVECLNATQIAKKCSKTSSRNTVSKALKKLEELNLLSKEVFTDDFGKYKKLYNLDGEYVLLDFDKRPIQKLVTCIKSEGVALFLILKKYCNIYGKCTLTQGQLLEKLGYNVKKDGNRKRLNLFLETLEDIGCVKIEKTFTKNELKKNIYYCLV